MTSTTTTGSAATVGAIYEAFGSGDLSTIVGHLADDVAWDDWPDNFAQRAGVPHLAARRGPDDVTGFFGVLAGYRLLEFDIVDVIGNGRQVVAEVRAAFETPGGGRFADEELHLWTFDDAGRVSRFRHYVDTAKHIAASRGEDTLAGGVSGARPAG